MQKSSQPPIPMRFFADWTIKQSNFFEKIKLFFSILSPNSLFRSCIFPWFCSSLFIFSVTIKIIRPSLTPSLFHFKMQKYGEVQIRFGWEKNTLFIKRSFKNLKRENSYWTNRKANRRFLVRLLDVLSMDNASPQQTKRKSAPWARHVPGGGFLLAFRKEDTTSLSGNTFDFRKTPKNQAWKKALCTVKFWPQTTKNKVHIFSSTGTSEWIHWTGNRCNPRLDDTKDKWSVTPENSSYSAKEIWAKICLP